MKGEDFPMSFDKTGRRRWAVVAVSLASLCSPLSAQQPLPFSCGFEPPSYAAGPLPQHGWEAETGSSATVQRAVAYEAQSALAIDAGGAVDQLLDPTGGVVWVDGYQLGVPSLDLPDLTGLTSGAAIVAFHTSGVLCLNGAGDGTAVSNRCTATAAICCWSACSRGTYSPW